MNLGVKEVAALMNVSENTVYRWIRDSKLPAFRVNEQYRFNRAELLEWATSRRLNVSAELFAEPADGRSPAVSLADALRAGGVHYRVAGADKAAALKSAIDVMPLPDEVDRGFLLKVLQARESLGSTGIGDGIAIPHVRNPIVMHVAKPRVSLCFLEHPVDFDSIDGKPVHTLFVIVSPTVSGHLSLLARLGFALRHPGFASAIASRGTQEEILTQASALDSSVPRRKEDQGEGAP
jgi:nitrogen PTS system EIIA component